MIFFTPASSAALSNERPPSTLLWKYFRGFVTDSPTYACAAKCMIAPTLGRTRPSALASSTSPLISSNPAARDFVAGAQVVEDNDFMTSAFERPGGMAPDVSRAADDENNHCRFLSGVDEDRTLVPLMGRIIYCTQIKDAVEIHASLILTHSKVMISTHVDGCSPLLRYW